MVVNEPSAARVQYLVEKTALLRTSPLPQWVDAPERLEDAGVALDEAVLVEWEAGGQHAMMGLIGTRDGRVFFCDVTYDYDRDSRPLETGVGWIHSWNEVPQKEIGFTASGYPNSWLHAVDLAKRILAAGNGRDVTTYT